MFAQTRVEFFFGLVDGGGWNFDQKPIFFGNLGISDPEFPLSADYGLVEGLLD